MLSRSHPIILFIDRTGFSVYQDTLINIPKFNFTPDLVANLDVINKEQFTALISTFIQINKIVPSDLAVILSDNVIFVKDLANPVQKSPPAQDLKEDIGDDKDNKDEAQDFLEDVPFEEVLAKVIKMGSMNRVVAVNKDLVMTIVDVFTGNKSVIEAVTPSFIFGQNANFTTGLTLINVKIILEDTETLKLGNLLTDQQKTLSPQGLESEVKNLTTDVKPDLETPAKKPRSLRQYILIGVFVTLLIILVVVYFNMGASQTTSQTSKTNVSAGETVTPTLPQNVSPSAQISITGTPITSASATTINSIVVKVTQDSETNPTAETLKSALAKIGLQSIATEISETSPEKSSVVISKAIPADLRDSIVVEIKKILPDINVLEGDDTNYTVNIVLGKS